MKTFSDSQAQPIVGDYEQDTIGHWYRILEVRASGWQYRVDQVYVSHNSETGATKFNSYRYQPILMGRSEFKFSSR